MRDAICGEVYSCFILLSCTKGVFERVSVYRPCLVKAHGLGRGGGARWRKAVPAWGSVTEVLEKQGKPLSIEDLRQNLTAALEDDFHVPRNSASSSPHSCLGTRPRVLLRCLLSWKQRPQPSPWSVAVRGIR